MRILFFIDTLEGGGMQRRFVELLKSLRVHTEVEASIIVMEEEIHYQEIRQLEYPIGFLIRKTKKDFTIFGKFLRICWDYKPDIVHAWGRMPAFYAIPACRFLKIKLINSQIADSPIYLSKLSFFWWSSRINFRFSDLIIANSIAGIHAYQAPVEKSISIHNGFNFDRILQLQPEENIREKLGITTPFIVGMVANYSNYKDFETYTRAAIEIVSQRQDTTFLGIGKDLGTKVSSLELISNVPHKHLIRLMDQHAEIESIVNSFTIGILCSYSEGISNSIMEYMALGKPVIATSKGGTAELVSDKITGYLISSKDVTALVNYINNLLDEPGKRSAMGLAGQHRIEKLFSIERMKDLYLNEYSKLLINHS